MPDHRGPQWMDHAIWWHVYPLTMTGAPRELDPNAPPAHRLSMIEEWLDHAIALGASGIQLGPIFRSATHGYDTLDYFSIDPRLGDDADFERLITACHERGLKVMCDGVFNHVSRDHAMVRGALEAGPGSEAAGLIDLRQAEDGNWYPQLFEGHPGLVELNHADPRVADLVESVMMHWCERGVEAWRMDAAYAVPPTFWKGILERVRARFPELLVIGEVIHGDYSQIIADSGMDSLTEYELWKSIWSSIETGNLFELDWTLRRHDEFLETFVPTTFVGNHDTTRIATKVGADGAAVAATILMSVGGMPVVYHGDEWALRGFKEDRPGGDDAVRPAFLPRPGIDEGGAGELANGDSARMWSLYRALISARRRHPWLVDAGTVTAAIENLSAVWEVRGTGAGEVLYLDVDLSGAEPWARLRDLEGILVDTRG